MPTHYHCPRCMSFQVKEQDRSIFCPRCKLNFDKKFLDLLEDEDILANEELNGIIDLFIEDTDDINDLSLVP